MGNSRVREVAEVTDPRESIEASLNRLLIESGVDPIDPLTASRFANYFALLVHWNSRTNLTALRDEGSILRRHYVESILCARYLPAGIRTLLDYGSGAGFPGLPIALCRPEIAVTLAESQGKKAAFLREVLRTLDLNVTIHAERAETLAVRFDCVTLRAVDKMTEAVSRASALVSHTGWLGVLTTVAEWGKICEAPESPFDWNPAIPLFGQSRVLALGRRTSTKSLC
jgi:16S rRNA (guanine527-N7)-methyltransferase